MRAYSIAAPKYGYQVYVTLCMSYHIRILFQTHSKSTGKRSWTRMLTLYFLFRFLFDWLFSKIALWWKWAGGFQESFTTRVTSHVEVTSNFDSCICTTYLEIFSGQPAHMIWAYRVFLFLNKLQSITRMRMERHVIRLSRAWVHLDGGTMDLAWQL